jgi:predicted PurR-regulated permease PerM
VLGGWFDRSRGWMLARSLALGRGIFELTISVVISFFFYRDGPAVVARVSEGVRRITGDFSQHLVEVVGNTTKSVVYGLLGTAVAQGTMAGIGFRIAGIPGAFLWGLLTFFLSLFPAGPPLVWVPATLWLLFRDEVGWAVFMGLWGFFAISGIDNIVRPMLISRGTTLPFALTLLGVMGGVFAFGFIGVFLGPTVLAAGYSLLQEFLRQKRGGATEPADLATGAPPAPGAAGAPPP